MTRSYPILLVVLALAACQGAGDDPPEQGGEIEEAPPAASAGDRLLEIATVKDTLTAGATAEIRLENLTDRTIGFNLCPKILERRAGDGWTPLPETRPEACTLELRILSPGQTVVETTGIPPGLDAGTYRIVFDGISFEQGDPELAAEERTTNAFEIE